MAALLLLKIFEAHVDVSNDEKTDLIRSFSRLTQDDDYKNDSNAFRKRDSCCRYLLTLAKCLLRKRLEELGITPFL